MLKRQKVFNWNIARERDFYDKLMDFIFSKTMVNIFIVIIFLLALYFNNKRT